MRIKSFAMLAISGLLAASLSYIAPAMADDMGNTNPSGQTAAPDANTNNANNTNSSGTDNGTNTGSANSTDQGGPDTATGDDDY